MFNFGTSTPKTTAATAFTLPTTPATTAPTGFSFGGPGAGDNKLQSKPATGLFGTPTTTTQPTLSFGLGQPKATTTPAPSFGFGTPTTASLSLSASTVAATTSTSAPPQFSFGNKPTATASATSFTPIASTTTSSSIPASNVATTTSAPTLSFGLPTSSTPSSTSTIVAATTAPLAPSTTAVVTSASTTASATPQMTFAQLEDSINKWTIDLEEQGKFFINQAKQLNAWDSLLISNGEKILNLNNSIERVKQQQQQLDQELDFVTAQQKELEELIKPLEKELMDLPVTDIDRHQMYQYSEIIDSQLKQMSDDLKEVIEHINEANKDDEDSNLVVQINRILNAHMNSLQWIDMNSSQIAALLEEINKMQDSNRQAFGLNNSLNQSFNNV